MGTPPSTEELLSSVIYEMIYPMMCSMSATPHWGLLLPEGSRTRSNPAAKDKTWK